MSRGGGGLHNHPINKTPRCKQAFINSKDNILATEGEWVAKALLRLTRVINTSLDSHYPWPFCVQEPKQNVKNHRELLQPVPPQWKPDCSLAVRQSAAPAASDISHFTLLGGTLCVIC